jgi:hypothetical protein
MAFIRTGDRKCWRTISEEGIKLPISEKRLKVLVYIHTCTGTWAKALIIRENFFPELVMDMVKLIVAGEHEHCLVFVLFRLVARHVRKVAIVALVIAIAVTVKPIPGFFLLTV